MRQQIEREVKESIYHDPELKHPFKKFTIKPFDKDFLEKYGEKIKERLKETHTAVRKIAESMKRDEIIREAISLDKF